MSQQFNTKKRAHISFFWVSRGFAKPKSTIQQRFVLYLSCRKFARIVMGPEHLKKNIIRKKSSQQFNTKKHTNTSFLGGLSRIRKPKSTIQRRLTREHIYFFWKLSIKTFVKHICIKQQNYPINIWI